MRGVFRGVYIGLVDNLLYRIMASPVSYLVNETFEGAGTPDGWSGAADYDFVTDPLDGAQSLRIPSGSVYTPTFADTSPLYMTFHVETETITGLSGVNFIVIQDSGSATLGTILIRSTGALRATAYGGTLNDSASGIMTAGGKIYLKIVYTAGTGADAVLTIYSSTDRLNWTQRASSTNGTATTSAARVRLYPMDNGANVFDNVRVAGVDID